MIDQATAAAADAERARAQAQIDAISAMSNRFLEEGQRRLEAAQANVRRAREQQAANRTKELAKRRPPPTQQGTASSSVGRPQPPAPKAASRPTRIPRRRLRPRGYFE
jgi:hypothetical protein